VLCCETRSCHARRHNDLGGHSNFSSTSHVTETPLSRSKGQDHQAALLAAALTRQEAAPVSVRNVLAVGTYCYVAVCTAGAVGSAARGAAAPIEGGEGRGHIVAASCKGCGIVTVILQLSDGLMCVFVQRRSGVFSKPVCRHSSARRDDWTHRSSSPGRHHRI